ncbi:MAG TPA: hypothetical protein VK633_12835 [Verrucomicrobiae bacterium]|nr:hypothetical protein [Verrucomicrobiae bacterium]
MRVRVEVDGAVTEKPKILNMKTVPRVGEKLESASYGTCLVREVTHTPDSKQHAAILFLKKIN